MPAPGTAATPQPAQPEPQLERQHLPAQPPRPRASLSKKSKTPSIGGLIHSMQAKPSNSPYIIAAVTSIIWLFIGGLLGWLLVGQSLSDFSGYKSVLGSSSVYIMAAAVLVPIALFWFIAQLIWRSHEMKLMASAMTEVAIRLAEPDKMAEQKVASVGQTIRRQVSAMDDAISRALGRAGELEALVHNEVAALERSYSQNEFIIRNLLGELVSEREAIASNGMQVKKTLQGVGAQISKDIRSATGTIGDTLTQHGTVSAIKLQQAGEQVTKAMQATTNETVAIKQKIAAELPQLLAKMDSQQQKLGKVIEGASRNLGALDKKLVAGTADLDGKLAKRTAEIDKVIAKHTGELNKRLVQKVKALDASLAMRTKAMDRTLAQKAKEIDSAFVTHQDSINSGMQKKAMQLDRSIAQQAKAMDASLTEKARTIDKALTERLADIEQKQAHDSTKNRSDLSMLRGSQALEHAMNSQSKEMHAALDQNSASLDKTISKQNELSPQITALMKKHDQLLADQLAQAASAREQFAMQSADLMATARILVGPDMKMGAMMGPQQNKARAILGDIIARSSELERNRQAYGNALDNAHLLGEETSAALKQQLTADASPLAARAMTDLDRRNAENRLVIQQTKDDMAADQADLSRQVVESISAMSRSSSRTKVLPGDLANTSTDVNRAVREQLKALDALAQLSGAAAAVSQVTATGATSGGQRGGAGGFANAPAHPASAQPPQASANRTAAPAGKQQPSQWSFGDLLARVADTEHEEPPLPTYRPASASSSVNPRSKSALSLDPMDVLRMDDIARALDSHTAALAWQRYQSGERNVFSRRLYTPEGQKTFDHISQSYRDDQGLHGAVEKYVSDFEGLMREAEEKDPSGRVIQNYLSSETGRVYLMLAHISGRLG